MRLRLLTTMLAAATLAVPTAARGDAPAVTGVLCGMAAASQPDDWYRSAAAIWAGPVTVTDPVTGVPATATFNCCPSVNMYYFEGRECDLRFTGTGVVAGAFLTPVDASIFDAVYLCAFYEAPDNTRYRWNPDEHRWSLDPETPCVLATSVETTPAAELVDAYACDALRSAFPPEGDVPGVWSCSQRWQNPKKVYVAAVVA